jgi:energy-coupling factor transporter ATP-binding protein EcfA2
VQHFSPNTRALLEGASKSLSTGASTTSSVYVSALVPLRRFGPRNDPMASSPARWITGSLLRVFRAPPVSLSLPLASSPARWSSSSYDADGELARARKAAELAEFRSRERIAEATADAYEKKAEAEAAAASDKTKAEAAAAKAKAEAEADKAKAEVEADKAEAEAAAAKAKAEVEADKAEAEAAAAAAKAEVEADKAKAAAAKAKAKVEAAKAEAEADKAEAEADKAKAETAERNRKLAEARYMRWAAYGAVVFGCLFLAYDHYTHHNKAYLRRRIKAQFVAGPDESLLPESPTFPFLALRPLPIHVVGDRAMLVLGASGSGKSTQLGELARTFKAKGVPVVYFRFRANRTVSTGDATSRGENVQTPLPADLSVAAQLFFKAVGYQERPSFMSLWTLGQIKLSREGWLQVVATREQVQSRFIEAISDLFFVCDELYFERKADPMISPLDRRPVVLSDELHDLLHDRYRNVGGKAVFAHFGNEMTHACADNHRTRVIVAASGTDLTDQLEALSAAGGDRVFPYTQQDPPEAVVRERLAAVGYDTESVDTIVAACGTRVRPLCSFLQYRVADISEALAPLQARASARIGALLETCPEKAERRRLVELLDRLSKLPPASVSVRDLPKAVRDPFPYKALLKGVDDTVIFQSELTRQAWLRDRGKYV